MTFVVRGVAFVLVLVAIVSTVKLGDARASELDSVASCVAKTAKHQGFSGNVHSEEAWNLFAGSCK